jgi:hypothetical protein
VKHDQLREVIVADRAEQPVFHPSRICHTPAIVSLRLNRSLSAGTFSGAAQSLPGARGRVALGYRKTWGDDPFAQTDCPAANQRHIRAALQNSRIPPYSYNPGTVSNME